MPIRAPEVERNKDIWSEVSHSMVTFNVLQSFKNRQSEIFCHENVSQIQSKIIFVTPATKLGQGYVFTGVCDSLHGGST